MPIPPGPLNVKQLQPSQIKDDQQVFPGDGAILLPFSGNVILSKGSAAAITIVAPVAGTDDGLEIYIGSTTAFAHVVTSATVGFNGKGSSGTLTFGAAKGNGCILKAYNGNWYVVGNIGVTVA